MKLVSTMLTEYFEETGIQKSWFAKKIDMPASLLYQILNQGSNLPKKYWAPIVKMTRGKITLKNILEDHFRDVEGIKFEDNSDPTTCNVYLTKINKED